MKRSLVLGSEGQDGYYMAEHLEKSGGYEIYKVDFNYGPESISLDITDHLKFMSLLNEISPDEIYNFAGNSDNLEAFNSPMELLESNTKPVVTILDYIIKNKQDCRFLQASSSLIFGDSHEADNMQRIHTPKNPTTPYGCSKLYAYNLINTYRKHYGIFACNAILYNHESIRRRPHFLIPKIVIGAIECKKGTQKNLILGDLLAERDWLHAKDVVSVCHKILCQPCFPNDWIVSSGIEHSVRYVADYVFESFGMDYKDYVVSSPEFINKKQENNYAGDSSLTRRYLNWRTQYEFTDILDEIINFYKNKYEIS